MNQKQSERQGDGMKKLNAHDRFLERQRIAEQQQSDRVLFQAQTASIALTKQLEIYEAALESIIMMQPESLEATKAKQALAQVRGVEV